MIQLTATLSPVTIEEAKVQCKLDETDSSEDSLLNGLLISATRFCENRTHRALMQSDWLWSGKEFPKRLDRDGCFRLPMAPLVAVSSVKYWNGTLQTLAPSEYVVDTNNIPGRIYFKSYPSIDDRPDAVQITFTAGYGAAGAQESQEREAVPQDIKSCILMIVATLYENRQTMNQSGNITDDKIQAWVDSQLSHYFLPF